MIIMLDYVRVRVTLNLNLLFSKFKIFTRVTQFGTYLLSYTFIGITSNNYDLMSQ